jgi:hypothetical protein
LQLIIFDYSICSNEEKESIDFEFSLIIFKNKNMYLGLSYTVATISKSELELVVPADSASKDFLLPIASSTPHLFTIFIPNLVGE